MAKRMRTTAQIDAQRTTERAAVIAGMSERELAAWMTELAEEVNSPRVDWRLTLNHRAIIDQIRAELHNRKAAA